MVLIANLFDDSCQGHFKLNFSEHLVKTFIRHVFFKNFKSVFHLDIINIRMLFKRLNEHELNHIDFWFLDKSVHSTFHLNLVVLSPDLYSHLLPYTIEYTADVRFVILFGIFELFHDNITFGLQPVNIWIKNNLIVLDLTKWVVQILCLFIYFIFDIYLDCCLSSKCYSIKFD